ncbi:MAG: hypothetical protein ACTSO7_13995 [Candidatus Heimdallarchaeota archaeon]
MAEESEETTAEVNESKDKPQEEIINLSRCHWCNKEEDNENTFQEVKIPRKGDDEFNVYVCSIEHESRIKKSYNYMDKIFILGLILIFFAPLVFVTLTIIIDMIYSYPIFISIGLGLIIYPLFSQQVVKALGLQKSNILARVLGSIIILLGLALFLLDVLNVPFN